ncbi:helix-turn-helix domain-containing protein [Arthrobacter sp. fls2-241-R2A-172]|uniref:ArsR/SmtB family transcription factor n=1 Tax=Arthrobacter sp. fls2-241-R2A-172 TaxID=3040325 RepID=UPI00254EE837|nr:helix-turn-helix domain-containing protein [Arthrobacter sp. fls2-241-R2A-172]
MATDVLPAGEGFASLAALFADRTRATFCLALLDRRAWTASELANYAQVPKSSATEHLNKLIGAGILTEIRQGRHRYVRLEDARIAELIETMASHVEPVPSNRRSYTSITRDQALRRARTCYDHLAGDLGVSLMNALVARNIINLDSGVQLTPKGEQDLARAGISIERQGTRPLIRTCLDWTGRQYHAAGLVGGAICRHALASGWVLPTPQSRALKITDLGVMEMKRHFGLELARGERRLQG